jgi:hypothetical protein
MKGESVSPIQKAVNASTKQITATPIVPLQKVTKAENLLDGLLVNFALFAASNHLDLDVVGSS